VIGDHTTLAVMSALQAAGFAVLVPFGENTRYDLAIDDGWRLSRVQCRSGRLRCGGVRFNTCSSYAHHRPSRFTTRPYFGEIDFFGVYCSETDDVYLVPIEDVPLTRQAALRISPPRNGQTLRVRFASLTWSLPSL
jgi:PD-(D/E)XK endonuclease